MVQGVDARSRGGQDGGVVRPVLGDGVGEVAEEREVNARIEVAERLNLEVREQIVDRAHAAEQGRHDHHRATILGHSAVELETREHLRRDQSRQQALHRARRQLAGGDEPEECNQRDRACRRRVPRETAYAMPTAMTSRVSSAMAPRYKPVAWANSARRARSPRRGLNAISLSNSAAPCAGQVVADVRLPRVTGTIPAPAGGIDAIERDPDLISRGRPTELLDDATILIATDEVHAPVGSGRIAAENVLDLAHALEESTPVECAGEPQTGDRVGHRDLIRGLVLAFDANGVFRRHLPQGEPLIDVRSQSGDMRPVLADALEQANDEGQAGGVRDGAAQS